MRIPPFSRYRHFSQLTAVFVLGAVIGSVVYNSVFHSSFDMLWASNQDLELRIQQYEDDIKTLKNTTISRP